MKYRIGKGKGILILFFALLVDMLEIYLSLLVVGLFASIVSGIIQYGVIWIFFAMSGVKFFGSAKKIRRRGIAMIAESIPIVELLPIFTYSVWVAIRESRMEDEAKQSKKQENVIREKNNSANNPNIIRKKNE